MSGQFTTFLGVFFPHTIEIDEVNGKVYFLLYETYSARYSVKVISNKSLMEETLANYDSSWTCELMKNINQPLLMMATGNMTQQPTVSAFLGRAVEEKFHLKPALMFIPPAIPLLSPALKDMVHPDVGPTQLSEGVKEGYYLVNLSLTQNFDLGPEFFEVYNSGQHNDENDDGDDDDLLRILEESENQPPVNNDNDEIQETNPVPPFDREDSYDEDFDIDYRESLVNQRRNSVASSSSDDTIRPSYVLQRESTMNSESSVCTGLDDHETTTNKAYVEDERLISTASEVEYATDNEKKTKSSNSKGKGKEKEVLPKNFANDYEFTFSIPTASYNSQKPGSSSTAPVNDSLPLMTSPSFRSRNPSVSSTIHIQSVKSSTTSVSGSRSDQTSEASITDSESSEPNILRKRRSLTDSQSSMGKRLRIIFKAAEAQRTDELVVNDDNDSDKTKLVSTPRRRG
ncbi:hypothetical protein G6F43_012010 [Rhizopus delemar]|nr:hypothetical protein G6F43_012010 [Rhizopus delemar]